MSSEIITQRAFDLDIILPALITVLLLLIVFRRSIKRVARGQPWTLTRDQRKELEEIVARHKGQQSDQEET